MSAARPSQPANAAPSGGGAARDPAGRTQGRRTGEAGAGTASGTPQAPANQAGPALDTLCLAREQDVVIARQRAREIARLLGFDKQDQARIATAVSEIARNAIRYACDGGVEFRVEGDAPVQHLAIRIADRGPGIRNLHDVLDGRYRSTSGMGLGIVGARRLMERFDIGSGPDGTVVVMGKTFETGMPAATESVCERLRSELRRLAAASPFEELQEQQRALLEALAEVREARDQLARLNRELEDTNRGVVALYAELDERAEYLRRADESKSRFLSNMSHEFRTPLNSIRALSQLLLDRVDGPLADEQERQVKLIRKATDDLSHLVEDLLDLARIEAGKLEIRPAEFHADDLFGALRGMMRPLLVDDAVTLHFVPPADVPPLFADEARVSQVLRNFVSNALKFTERGSVTVSVEHRTGDEAVVFCVADTGIGIAPEDRERIFDEFVQVRGSLQARVRGSGLGLPICRRLAQALGGAVYVESEVGVGSRFYLRLPIRYAPGPDPIADSPTGATASPSRIPLDEATRGRVLIVDDDATTRYTVRRLLQASGFLLLEATNGQEARRAAEISRPNAIVLDLGLPDIDGGALLEEFAASPATRAIPVIIATSRDLTEAERHALETRAFAVLSKRELPEALAATIRTAVAAPTLARTS